MHFSFVTIIAQQAKADEYLIRCYDTTSGESGYINVRGDTIIKVGKYAFCFTDTFFSYAIVSSNEHGFIGINRRENILYKIFPFDNGPDYVVEGLFRIIIDGKIGYADSATGNIIIQPQFTCAEPFENGVAKVATDCKKKSDGEHTMWLSNTWFYINKKGEKVDSPSKTNTKSKRKLAKT